MRIWKHSPADSLLLAFSVAQLAVTIWLATEWLGASVWGWAAQVAGLAVLTAYNIIVVSHLFTHVPWFVSAKLNAVVSVLNSVNIGQSVQAYQLTHVRNHHRFNNDAKGEDGTTKDTSSTYRDGEDGEHTPLLRYVLGGAWQSLVDRGREVLYFVRLWRVGSSEQNLLSLASRREPRRSRELRQIQVDRMAHVLVIPLFAVISWQWTLAVYLPAWVIALAMVNVQNYYRHYGADPDDRSADSVSYYGRLYNLLAFNDGYHQEHHLSPATHWSQMPKVRERWRARLDARERIVSPVPAMLGFLDRRRPLLHRNEISDGPVRTDGGGS
ncbi:fatty acid desaturase [Kibdelosporangium aridum]|uniref:Fatty acid desaturase n=1 Tax=Kibdelosporangium aridum TaxID=2030 RepID=A0A428Z4S1_KIBAR|nr:fatty acid desaturase [Kibdelosporangium aridum]RSM81602.1 fatty acid desaturase [Kibdelosporangium aridum]